MSGQLTRTELFSRLDDLIKEELGKHPAHTWDLKLAQSSHIKIYVGGVLVGVHKGKTSRSKSYDYKAPIAVRSQIRRAYAGVPSITGARVAPAVIGGPSGREKRAQKAR